MSIIIVTHNLGIVAELADRVIVMYAGQAVEEAETKELFKSMCHPYTQALFSAIPKLGHSREQLTTIPGAVPSPGSYPKGCRFYERCEYWLKLDKEAKYRCTNYDPAWNKHAPTHFYRCHLSSLLTPRS